MSLAHAVEKNGDRRILVYIWILLIGGLILLLSASSPLGYSKFQNSYFFVKKQILYGLVPGLALFVFFSHINYFQLKKWAWILYGVCLLLLALVFINGVGVVLHGARSWLNIGGFSFQPSELAKLSVIIMLSHLLTDQKRDWDNWQTSILPILAVLSPAVLLILLQPDVGTLSILAVSIFVILYVAQIPNRYLVFLGGLGLILFLGLLLVASYRVDRLTTFLHPELDPNGKGYQINQAKLAIGSGGFWGLGYQQSRQKYQYLPEVNADSIFAILAEEMGFIFSVGLIVLILLIGWRGLKIAAASNDEFGKLVVSGIASWVVWQSFLNIGGIMNALPLTGVPLPLVSHGGSSYIITLAALGIVMSVSKEANLIE
jgi:cell division protein FtsW